MKHNAKTIIFTVRLSQLDQEALLRFAEKTDRTPADAVRAAIRLATNLLAGDPSSMNLSSQTPKDNKISGSADTQ